MKLIFSADNNWGIGRAGRLLFRAKGDMARFKRLTSDKIVIMGRKTLESLPEAKPLPNRVNIVLTSDKEYKTSGGAIICHSISDIFEAVRGYESGDLFVIGGESVYRALLDYCDTAYVTRFYADSPADRFMPDFDTLPDWELTEQSDKIYEDGLCYSYLTYRLKKE